MKKNKTMKHEKWKTTNEKWKNKDTEKWKMKYEKMINEK